MSRRFIQRHGHETSFRVAFDDRSLHAYKVLHDGSIAEVLDEDSTTEKLLMTRNVPPQIGDAGILIKKPDKTTIEIAEPLGATAASYSAEAAAALKAFDSINSEDSSHVTWATDSKSLIDALSGDISKAGDHTQLVWRAIERHLNKGTKISTVWVPAHCGIPENEQADKLADGNFQTITNAAYPTKLLNR